MELTRPAKPHIDAAPPVTFLQSLNSTWHERGLQLFMVIVLAHWAEHLAQTIQIYALKWPVPESRGILGLYYPWLVKSEALHYGYAIVMLIFLWLLRPGFVGRSRTWWTISLAIQFWHHIEHLLLLIQANTHHFFWDRPVPTSVLQLVYPRVQLHLFYNSIVFIPMMIAVYYHLRPSSSERDAMTCHCASDATPAA